MGPLFFILMSQTCIDPDPYAELDNRADADELSDEFRKPTRILMAGRRGFPATRTGPLGPTRRIRL
ncbi:MAG: hypothetical protein ABS75_15580 [Pelagibacterium sp. SCN 63-23]|nr:MAG: hypothetical protein ABS75_15580 [Pelagibacterium sp. SCN 63-23]